MEELQWRKYNRWERKKRKKRKEEDILNRKCKIKIVIEFTCYIKIPLQQETVDGGVEIPDVLGKRAAMALLPAGDGAGFATISSLDPHVSHARRVLEDLDYAEGQILVEGILGDNVHAKRHRFGILVLCLLQIQSFSY